MCFCNRLDGENRFLECWGCSEGDISCGGQEKGMKLVVKGKLCKKLVKIRKVSARDMAVVLCFDEDMLRLVSEYALKRGRILEGKQSFYDQLKTKCS